MITLDRYLARLLLTLLLAVLPGVQLWAQHDTHRNATRAIASGKLNKARELLSRCEADDPETHFVATLLALREGQTDQAVRSAQAAREAGLPLSRLVAGPRELLGQLTKTNQFRAWLQQHDPIRLVHGPMVGSVTDTAASLWVRTAGASQVQVIIGEKKSPVVFSSPQTDFTAVARVTGLQPATDYRYQIFVNGQLIKDGRKSFRTYPEEGKPAKFSVAFGGGAGYVPNWERMWETIADRSPTALLMLGDNVYIDQPEYSLCQHYCYYRRQSRPEWRRLVACTPTYAIYDDHDFGTNDCVPGPEIENPAWKRAVWNTFRQNWVNPSYGGGQKQPGCWQEFSIGDVQFILLDGRYYRDRKSGSMLGPVQKAWLLETLKNSTATFKVLASPVPWTAGVKPGSRDPWDGFPQEREEIFSFLEHNNINGVFLISADRHRTDLRKTERADGYDLYEFESSRLTNRHTHGIIKTPGLIWGYNQTCSFGLMRFDTTASPPTVTFECVTIDGEVVHSHTLRADELRKKPAQ